MTFFGKHGKINVQRGKYCLEISEARKRVEISGLPFHSSMILAEFSSNLRMDIVVFRFYYQDIVINIVKGLLKISVLRQNVP